EGLRLVYFSGADVRDLLSSSRLRLRWLDLAGCSQSDLDVGRILDLPALAGLERLELRPAHLSDDTAARMAATPRPHPPELDVGTIGLTEAGIEALLTADFGPRLEKISLTAEMESADLLAAVLCRRSEWGRLRELTLPVTDQEDGVFARLLAHPAVTGLRKLSFFGHRI